MKEIFEIFTAWWIILLIGLSACFSTISVVVTLRNEAKIRAIEQAFVLTGNPLTHEQAHTAPSHEGTLRSTQKGHRR